MEILARAVGRRKEAVAQVQLVRGNGQFLINNKPAQAYLQNNSCSLICIKSPLESALSLYSNNFSNVENTSNSGLTLEDPLSTQTSIVPEGGGPDPKGLEKRFAAIFEKEQNALKTISTEESLKHQESGPLSFSSLPTTTLKEGDANFTNGSVNSETDPLLFSSTKTSIGNGASDFFAKAPSILKTKGATDTSGEVNISPFFKQGINGSSTGSKLAFVAEKNLQPALSLDEIDVIIKVKGGGLIGQAEAIKLGIARAFCLMHVSPIGIDGLLRKTFKTKGFLTQDSRIKERRKYGLKKARKASQYHKR